MEADRYRPCENPKCLAIDSTHCEFRIGDNGMVVPSQIQKAKEVGCRVARFEDAEMEGGPHEYA